MTLYYYGFKLEQNQDGFFSLYDKKGIEWNFLETLPAHPDCFDLGPFIEEVGQIINVHYEKTQPPPKKGPPHVEVRDVIHKNGEFMHLALTKMQ